MDALEQANKSVKLTHLLMRDMHALCSFYVRKQRIIKDQAEDKADASEVMDVPEDELDLSYDTSTAITAAAHNALEDPLSLIEKTALRVKPILEEVMQRMIPETGIDVNQIVSGEDREKRKKVEADMRIVLGYLNQSELITNLNIGNIMQIKPVSMEEMLVQSKNETQLNRQSFLDKIALLCVSYFCISTEIRFII